MIYPPFLKRGSRIGITAPSAGVPEKKAEGFALSLDNLRKAGFHVSETASVRGEGLVSAPGKVRAAELKALFDDPQIDMILCACGGDFLIDILPYVDFEAIRRSPKWVQGYSDPTGLLFPITTKLDIATVYGCNAGGFDMETLHPSLIDNLDILRGNFRPQNSFVLYESSKGFGGGYTLDTPVEWKTPNGPVDVTGRMIGGCIECLADLIGTPYDGAADFVRRYRKDGILWYFDVFAMKAETVYNTLWHMREAGWFENAVGFVFGRVLFEGSFLGLSYCNTILRALGTDVPVILDADIGHVPPRMTVINGAVARIRADSGKGSLEFSLNP